VISALLCLMQAELLTCNIWFSASQTLLDKASFHKPIMQWLQPHSFTCVNEIILVTNYRLFVSIHFTSSLESTPCFSPSTSSQSFYLWLTSFCTCQAVFLSWFTTVVIHYSLTLSLPDLNLPVSQILSIINRVPVFRMVGVSASVNLPLHHKVQKFSSSTGSPGWSQKGRKMVVVWCGGINCVTKYTDHIFWEVSVFVFSS